MCIYIIFHMEINKMIGQRIGKLVVVSPAPRNKYKHLMWECKCDCGNTCIVTQSNLKRSKPTQSCGCILAKKNGFRSIDISGKRFGRLTAMQKVENNKSYQTTTWLCRCDCGGKVVVEYGSLTRKKNPTQSCGCLGKEYQATINNVGPNNPVWKGGRTQMSTGYIRLAKPYVEANHPDLLPLIAFNRGFFVHEHVLVMTKMLGRALYKNEVVHHKNGIRDDNRPENLELCTTATHILGQRVNDMVAFCREYLARYDEDYANYLKR